MNDQGIVYGVDLNFERLVEMKTFTISFRRTPHTHINTVCNPAKTHLASISEIP